MYNAEQVAAAIKQMQDEGIPLSDAAWNAALMCIGWAYVFGAWGELCTPQNRRSRYRDDHPTIKSKCQNFSGTGACTGCKWYPAGMRTRIFDCRGFTYWVLYQVFGFKLSGQGATSQWNTESNWTAKGTIDTIPADTLVCVFVQKGAKMEHTGLAYNHETIECSNGVQHSDVIAKKWTHWALPVCVSGVTPEPKPPEQRPTLRRGDSGSYVTLAQTELINKGYSCGSTGADGKFGKNTEAAVKRFQLDHGLTADGVIGSLTWSALDGTEPAIKYTVTVHGLTATQADALILQYPGSEKAEERG